MLHLSHALAHTCPEVQMSAHVFERWTQQCASNMQTSDRKPVRRSTAPPLRSSRCSCGSLKQMIVRRQTGGRLRAKPSPRPLFHSRCCRVRCLPHDVQPKVLRHSMETEDKYLKFVPSHS